MTKPQWLIEAEKKKNNNLKYTPRTCGECANWNEPVDKVKVLGQSGKHIRRKCAVHHQCINTRFAYACEDFLRYD